MKLMVVGHGRHGKDTVSEILRDHFGLTFQSSSQFCCDLFIFDELKDKYGYKTSKECYDDRHNHRSEWFDLICDYNKNDLARLGKALYEQYDVYCGLRNKHELGSLKRTGIIDAVIWVDRSKREPLESNKSMTITKDMADYCINNNGTLEELQVNVYNLMFMLSLEKEINYGIYRKTTKRNNRTFN